MFDILGNMLICFSRELDEKVDTTLGCMLKLRVSLASHRDWQ